MGTQAIKVIISYMLKIFMNRDKKLLIYLMIMQKLDLKLFTNQNEMKLKKHDLKYLDPNK